MLGKRLRTERIRNNELGCNRVRSLPDQVGLDCGEPNISGLRWVIDLVRSITPTHIDNHVGVIVADKDDLNLFVCVGNEFKKENNVWKIVVLIDARIK